jgi:GTP cyclohydrolase I
MKDESTFDYWYRHYTQIPNFRVDENCFDKTDTTFTEEVHYIMRMEAEFYLRKTFQALKIDLNDANLAGETGTPYRIVKTWTGKDLDDDSELLSGRFMKEPRLATFPNDSDKYDPVFITTSINAVCSHHFIRFGSEIKEDDSIAIIGYIPSKKVLGLSKINRYINWLSRRGWLQENLTHKIGVELMKICETESVFVKLLNLSHGCVKYRGALDQKSETTTVFKTGQFEKNENLIPLKWR